MLFKKFLPENIFPETVAIDKEHRAVDEWMQSAIEEPLDSTALDTLEIEEEKISPDSLDLEKPEPVELDKSELIKSDLNQVEEQFYLEYFYSQLFRLEQNPDDEKVRIAYFGDSMTDGDLIVQDIRRKFQEKYGGRGIGFVPITSESAKSRASIIHRFSDNWTSYSFMKKDSVKRPYGVSGMVFYANDSVEPAELRFKRGVNASNNLLPNPTLYYGQSTNDSAEVKMIAKKDTSLFELNPQKNLNKLSLSSGILSEFELDFSKADSIPFYGVNFDISTGVQIDNFSKRGNSGLPLTQLDANLMKTFQQDLQYDLIVLHFGTNVLNRDSFKYGWYQARMKRVVAHVRRVFPESSILVISIADKSTKYDTEMQTDSAVNHLLAAQKAYAKEAKTGFVNLYALMGGEGSMVKWVEEEPPRANKDYTHFNSFGAREIAEMIYGELEHGFQEFKERRKTMEKKEINDSIFEAEKFEQQKEDELQKQDSTDVDIP
ncbi:MAG TPA: hypothetical protein VK021_03410 [Flavobacteriaceae bacterium]|nr:hypothetical protein [Flavobacteriaceae bacterium]